jgi:iron(III) transport system ATP-binding protein
MARDLRLENLSRRFGRVVAVDRVSLEIREGEFVCILGPSGCGKTTLLRLVAGFEVPSEGRIFHDGREITALIPQKRNFGIVFQSYALFPNMTVFDNVAFGLRARRVGRDRLGPRVEALLDLVGLRRFRDHYPAELSGGQQQRVALIRALAPEPSVLLLDEPLSALDARIRVHLRTEIRRLQRRLGITTVYVTHDQEEAMVLADRIVVMEGGTVQQVGSAGEIYRQPRSRFVADFVGTSNLLECRRVDTSPHTVAIGALHLRVAGALPEGRDPLSVAIRPEMIERLAGPGDLEGREASNVMEGVVEGVTFLGAIVRVVITVDQVPLIVDLPYREFERRPIRPEDRVQLYLPPDCFLIYPGA